VEFGGGLDEGKAGCGGGVEGEGGESYSGDGHWCVYVEDQVRNQGLSQKEGIKGKNKRIILRTKYNSVPNLYL